MFIALYLMNAYRTEWRRVNATWKTQNKNVRQNWNANEVASKPSSYHISLDQNVINKGKSPKWWITVFVIKGKVFLCNVKHPVSIKHPDNPTPNEYADLWLMKGVRVINIFLTADWREKIRQKPKGFFFFFYQFCSVFFFFFNINSNTVVYFSLCNFMYLMCSQQYG